MIVLYSTGESEQIQEFKLIMPGDESRSPVHKLPSQCSRHARKLFMPDGRGSPMKMVHFVDLEILWLLCLTLTNSKPPLND